MRTMALVMRIMRMKTSMMRDTAKHCKTSPINSNERHRKTKTALYISQDHTCRGQVEEMLNNRRHKKLTKGSNKLADGWKQL